MKKTISIITPVYNEEKNIDFYYKRIKKVIDLIGDYDFEIIFTDNCSSDNTFAMIEDLAQRDQRIKAYRFSRNYGYQRSIFTGYMKSSGDCVIEFDCDLQDPPELLPEFIKAWEAGNKIVYGKRIERPEGIVLTKAREMFYRILAKVSENDLPTDAGDFMLLDRMIVDQLVSIRDHHIYIRGEVFSLGFKRYAIPYKRDERLYGDSKFPLKKLLLLAVDGFISQSTLPLRLASCFGVILAIITALMIFIYLALHITGIINTEGFTTTTILILLSISVNAIFLGIIGEYLARLYANTNNKPFVIIEQRIGDNDDE